MSEHETHKGRPYDLTKMVWIDDELWRTYVQYPPVIDGCGLDGPCDDYDDIAVYLIGHVDASSPLEEEHRRPAINPATGEILKGVDGKPLPWVTIPAHDDTFERRVTSELPADAHGYWVISAAGANSAKVRTRPRPEHSLANGALAYAIELDGAWLPLTSQRTIQRGLDAGLIELEFSNWGGATWTD